MVFCLLAAGCTDTDWDHAMRYGGMGAADEAPAQPRPRAAPRAPEAIAATPAAEPANANFCRAVAAQDAGGNGFDQPTQARVFARSYAQCLTIYTH